MKFAYDSEGALVKTTNPEGNSQNFEWDQDGTLARAIDGEGRETQYRYNQQKLVEAVANPKGEEISLGYDRHLNVSRITLPDGSSAQFKYDARGNCISETNPLGAVEAYPYDSLNRMVRAYLSDGNQIALAYDGYDGVLKAKDSQREVNFAYTILGSMASRSQDGRTVRHHYNSEEQLVSVTNEKGEVWEFERDAGGSITKEVQYGGQTYEYKRDYSGLVKEIRRPGGRYARFQHDKIGQVIRADYHDQSFEAFAYDKNGTLKEAENQHVKVRLERDKAGQVTKEWQDYDWAANEYDGVGNRVRTTSRFGADIRMERNAMGQVAELAAYRDNKQRWSAQMDYNRLGQETRRLASGGICSSFEYDKTGRPVSHIVGRKERPRGGGEYRRRQYEWGINFQLKRVTNELSGGSIIYSYDSFGSLVASKADQFEKLFRVTDEVVKPDRSGVSFIYAPFGRRIEKAGSQAGSEKTLPKAEADFTLEETPWVQVGGGFIRKPVKRKQDSNLDAGAERSLYEEESLESKTQYRAVTRFLWSGDTLLHEWEVGEKRKRKLRERKGEKAEYLLNMEEKADQKARTVAENRTEPPENLITWVFQDDFIPRAKLTEAGSYSIISDYLGTPVEAYDEEGEKVWERELDIYGRVKSSRKDRFGSTIELVGGDGFIPFRYQGQYEDVEAGLYYNRFRYYSPSDGCYTQVDPIGLAGGNPTIYSYVFNPLIQIDPFGLVWKDMAPLAKGGMGHHLLPRSIAKKLGVPSEWRWFPNNTVGSGAIHQQLHANLKAQGISIRGTKYTGTLDEFYDSAGRAYSGIDVKGYAVEPKGQKSYDVTPKQTLDKMKDPQGKATPPYMLMDIRKGKINEWIKF